MDGKSITIYSKIEARVTLKAIPVAGAVPACHILCPRELEALVFPTASPHTTRRIEEIL